MNSLVVQTLFTGVESSLFARWFDAAVSALSRAETTSAGGWQILAGCISGRRLCSDSVQAYERRAADAGGAFAVVDVGNERLAAHRQLAAMGSENLILVLDLDVTVLASTIDRLVAAARRGVAVAPRELPLGGHLEHDEPDPTPGCVLLTAVQLSEIDSLSSGQVCQEAAVHRDRRLPDVDGSKPQTEGPGSLLESALAIVGANSAGSSVEALLSMPGAPLLSIVMRTQLLRPEALRDALLCLAGQSDLRFELLLVVHDADFTGAAEILSDQPERLRSRTRILSARDGTRSRPLNVGIAAARGSHVSFLDDDDLVFGHWVASLLDGAERFPRRLVRSAAAVQSIGSKEWPGAIEGHEVESRLTVPYPTRFDLADHLRVNMTPFMVLAFPRRFFDVLGGADESLDVCEDWDLVLRAASVLGVGDVPQVTAVYRRWTTGLDSYTVHEAEIWRRDMMRVRAKLDRLPLLMPPGSVQELVDMSLLRESPDELAAVYRSTSWRVTRPLRAVSRFGARCGAWFRSRIR